MSQQREISSTVSAAGEVVAKDVTLADKSTERSGRRCWCKCLCACLACSTVLLAVMIPLGVFVILPAVAQHYLDDSALTLMNTTILPCDSFMAEPYEAQVINLVDFDSAAPVDVSVQEYEVIFTAYVCSDGTAECANRNNATQLGVARMPQMSLHSGSNSIEATTTLAITCDPAVLLGGVLAPLLTNKSLKMTLSAESLTASVLGVSVDKLKLRKDLNCSFIGLPANPITSAEYCPHSKNADDPVFGAVSMKCAPLNA